MAIASRTLLLTVAAAALSLHPARSAAPSNCAAGQFGASGSSNCYPCAKGAFASAAGATSCIACGCAAGAYCKRLVSVYSTRHSYYLYVTSITFNFDDGSERRYGSPSGTQTVFTPLTQEYVTEVNGVRCTDWSTGVPVYFDYSTVFAFNSGRTFAMGGGTPGAHTTCSNQQAFHYALTQPGAAGQTQQAVGLQQSTTSMGIVTVGVLAAPLYTGKGGFYSDQTGATECKACAPGASQAKTGMISCAACAAGAYQDEGGASSCAFLGVAGVCCVVGGAGVWASGARRVGVCRVGRLVLVSVSVSV